jgi:O-6-methylguanine DNA methyltransferase
LFVQKSRSNRLGKKLEKIMPKNKSLTFKERVLLVVANIKKGEVLTYKEVAILSKNSRAYRAVGNILNKNYNPQIPCHRVIRSNGKIGGYNRGSKLKEVLLDREAKYATNNKRRKKGIDEKNKRGSIK